MTDYTPPTLSCDSRQSGIYRIRNLINDKQYIGSTKNFRDRAAHHQRKLDHNTHRNRLLREDWGVFGESSFVFEIVEVIDDLTMLEEREQYYIDTMPDNLRYNIRLVVPKLFTDDRSRPHEVRAKIANTLRGKKRPPELMKDIAKKNLGQKRSDETKQKISKAWERRKAEGRGGWTDGQREKFQKRMLEKQEGINPQLSSVDR